MLKEVKIEVHQNGLVLLCASILGYLMCRIWVGGFIDGSACAFENISHFDFAIFNAQVSLVN